MLRDQFYKNINAQMIAELKIRKRVRELILEKSKERLSGEKLKKVQDEWTDDGSNAKRLNLKKEIAKYGYLINPKKDFIGEGAFGAVFTAVNQKKAPGKFAVKAIHKEDSKSTYVIYATSIEEELKNYEFFSPFTKLFYLLIDLPIFQVLLEILILFYKHQTLAISEAK